MIKQFSLIVCAILLSLTGIAQQVKHVVIITIDGFHNVNKTILPNVWLKNAGLITDVKNNNWKAQFNTVGGSAYLYLKDKNDKTTLHTISKILEQLPDSTRRLFRIISRKQLDAIGANPQVAFALTAENDASFAREATGEAIRPGKGGAHGHFPDHKEIQTGFIAYGKTPAGLLSTDH